MRRLVVGVRAEGDLREIWVYSFRIWGEAQADRCFDELDEGLRLCGADPERGRVREDVRPGYGSRLVRKHVVFCTFTDDQVLIQRVLHGSRSHAASSRRRERGLTTDLRSQSAPDMHSQEARWPPVGGVRATEIRDSPAVLPPR